MKKKQKKNKPAVKETYKRERVVPSAPVQTTRIALFIIIAITFIAYLPSLSAGFVDWDDPDYVQNNPMLRDVSNLELIITKPIQGNYHPITVLSLALNYAISGLNPWSYHLLNLLLHLFNCWLVFRLVMLLSRNKLIIAFTTSLLFGIHPMHVESVAWVSERKDVLYGLFFFAGLIAYTRFIDSGSRKQYRLAILFFLLSLLSKPAAVIFPVALFCIDILRARKLTFRSIAEKGPFFLLAIAMGLFTFIAQNEKGAIGGSEIFSWGTRFLMGCYGIMMYFIKLILPVKLSPFYAFAPINEALPTPYYIAPLFCLLMVALIIYSLKRNRVIAFGLLFYLVNLLLVLQFLPVGSAIIADRYTYIPYVGLFYIGGWLVDRLTKENLSVAYYILIPLGLILGILTYRQSRIWKNTESLWDHAIKITPSAKAYENRGNLYKREKKYDEALRCYNEALKLNIGDHGAFTSRGNLYFEMNKPDLAFADYKKALSIKPDYFPAFDNIGALFGLRRQFDSALIYFDRALAINPAYAPSFKNRGLARLELNRNEDAIRDFSRFLEHQPNDPDVMNMIGVCYRNLGKNNEALAIINEAIAIKPDPHFYLNRAYCYNNLNNKEAARKDALIAKQGGLSIEAEFARAIGLQ